MFIWNYNLEPRNKVKRQSHQNMQVNIQLWFALSGVLMLVNSIIHISELFRKWKSMRVAGKCAIACALTRRRVGANQPIPAAIWVSFTWHSTLADSTLVNMLAHPFPQQHRPCPFYVFPMAPQASASSHCRNIGWEICLTNQRHITSVRFYLPPCWWHMCSFPNGSKRNHSVCFSLSFSLDGWDCHGWRSYSCHFLSMHIVLFERCR